MFRTAVSVVSSPTKTYLHSTENTRAVLRCSPGVNGLLRMITAILFVIDLGIGITVIKEAISFIRLLVQ